MKSVRVILATLCLFLLGFNACEKDKNNDTIPDLTNTEWVCDTNYYEMDYYYRITFTSKSNFDYYENGVVEFNDKGTYSYNPPKIDITLWGITIEGSIEGNKLYYPTLSSDDVDAIMRVFTKQ